MSTLKKTDQDEDDPKTEPEILQEKILHRNGEVEVRKYLKGKLLGKGSFCKCNELTDIEQNKMFAAKFLSKTLFARNSTCQKFRKMIKLHKSLHHENIVQFERVFQDRENIYILLELCPNQTMKEHLRVRKRISEHECALYLDQIIQALKYLHEEKKIFHRYLNLRNLLLGKSFEIKLTSFLLTHRIEDKGEERRDFYGAANNMTPEFLKPEEESEKVDIWALGVICYELLIGRNPFLASDTRMTYQKLLKGDYSFPESVAISEEAKDLISKILVLDPAKRLTLKEILEHPFMRKNPGRIEIDGLGVHVNKWIDYSTKYGLGYLLSDGTAGIVFLDGTRMMMPANMKTIEYSRKQVDQETENIAVYSIENYPMDLEKKVLLTKYFKNYLMGEDYQDDQSGKNENKIETEEKENISIEKTSSLIYVKEWVKTKDATFFFLSNKIIQVDFLDKTQIILNSQQQVVCYRNKNGERRQHALMTALEIDYPEMVKRLKYTKEVLIHLKKERDCWFNGSFSFCIQF